MRVFVTGATGFVGSAIVHELLGAGHRVLGLARSDAAAASLAALGAEAVRGDLGDLDSLRRGAAQADGVIHTAFIHDFTTYRQNCESDRGVVEALGAALEGTDRPLLVTSATVVPAQARLATEDDAPHADATVVPRATSEHAAAAVAARGVRAAVVRLPPTVHGDGDHAFVPLLIRLARETGVSAHVGEGLNRWPAVHVRDAARLYRLALEDGARDPRYHAVAEEGVPFRAIARVIGRRLNLPVAALTAEAASAHFGWLAHFAAHDNPTSSRWSRERLGWTPKHPELLPDLDRDPYFAT